MGIVGGHVIRTLSYTLAVPAMRFVAKDDKKD